LKIFNGWSIRRKLFLIVFLSFGVLLTLLSWLIGEGAKQVSVAEIHNTLKHTEAILEESWRNRFERIANVGLTLARDQRVGPLVIDRDHASLQDLSNELKTASELDILMFVDADARILARTDKPQVVGRQLRQHHLIDMALTGQESRGFMVTGGKIYQIVTQPIYDLDVNAQDIIRGAVAVAFQVSGQLTDRIKRLTSSDIAIYAFAKSKQKTVEPKLQALTEPQLGPYLSIIQEALFTEVMARAEAKQQGPIQVYLGGVQYHIAVYPLEKSGGGALGYVLAMKSQSELSKPFEKIKTKIIWIGFFCLWAASLLAWLLSGGITKPIKHLSKVMKRIQDGNYPSEKYFPESDRNNHGDEVGALLTSIYRLGERLKDNQDLQDYLAKISDGLLDDEHAKGLSKAFSAETSIGNSGFDRSILIESGDLDRTVPLYAQTDVTCAKVKVGSFFAGERFKILKELGSGGMGTVYLARDTELDEKVALKILYQVNDKDESLLKYEIKLARKITARNVLRTFDYGVANQQIYISMEYMHGYDLHTLLKRSGGRIKNIRLAVILAQQMASAIASAHEQSIVHRDINPRNMMVSTQGILKVMDFGLALHLDAAKSNIKLVGTPHYMAPEQIMREGIDERTDIYQLGAVFYRIFAGQTPFRSVSLKQLLESHMREPVPEIRSEYPDVPAGIDLIVQKAMAKKPSDRYQTIDALQADLQGLHL